MFQDEAYTSAFFASMLFTGVTATVVLSQWLARKRISEEPLIYPWEARIVDTTNVLLVLSDLEDLKEGIAKNFCGTVVTDMALLPDLVDKTVYLSGDISNASSIPLSSAKRVFVIKEFCNNIDFGASPAWEVIDSGRVPLLVHGVGVYYRRFFDSDADYFNKLRIDHEFQSLTESNKPGVAHRTGIYLTHVKKEGDDVHFNLLRCSSNLGGPTGNFRENDLAIVNALNQEAASVFHDSAPLNHVLAQVYHNTPAANGKKETKAKIKDHSDKTKDMPKNGVMALCTFYDRAGLDRLQRMGPDGLDYGHKGVSALTKLQFRLKPEVAKRPGCTLTPAFSVTLYPDSAFLMSLSTNRLYTHEIRPSSLNADMLPTRMGYVVRCSNAEAIHRDGRTFLKMGPEDHSDVSLVEMEPPTQEGMKMLRQKYAEENATASCIDYGPVLFSMNRGDYERPLLYDEQDENGFRLVDVKGIDTDCSDIFDELLHSVQFEDVCKGRRGAVLVRPHESRGVPIVRTTTKYTRPAECFKSVHVRLAEAIQKSAALPVGFNNALIEHYSNQYTTMGYHSDQALDLEDDSYIAVYSCYKHPEKASSPPRKLIVESKEQENRTFEIPMAHNSVIVFSLGTNSQYKHKIVLDPAFLNTEDNPWIGVTLRLSKSFVHFEDEGGACLEDGTPLSLANEDECREFYKQRKLENVGTSFKYDTMNFTISKSDLIPPTP